jgi:hypothetical protein
MQRTLTMFMAAGLVVGVAATGHAQGRSFVPQSGQAALSVGAGVAVPSDDALDSGLAPRIGLDYYVTPRASLRFEGGMAWNDLTFGGDERVRPLFLAVNGVYNWEAVRVHPFLTAGFGVYSFNVEQLGSDVTTNKPGFNFGGGVEYFLNGYNALRGDVAYHAVVGSARGPLTSFDTSFWSTTIAFKHYF